MGDCATREFNCPGEPLLEFQTLAFYRAKNPDGLLPVKFFRRDDGSEAIKLAVRTGAFAGPLCEPCDNVNDRCELWQIVPFRQPTEVWYGFSIRIPDDFPSIRQRCVIAQIKCPYGESRDVSPAFSLRIDQRRFIATIEHLYELDDQKAARYLTDPDTGGACLPGAALASDHSSFVEGDPYDLQMRAILALDKDGLPEHLKDNHNFNRCTSGVYVTRSGVLPPVTDEWVDFIVHFKPSLDKKDGCIAIYVDGKMVAEASGEFGAPQKDGTWKQYFKIGPYRNNDPLNPDKTGEPWPADQTLAFHVSRYRSGATPRSVGLMDNGLVS